MISPSNNNIVIYIDCIRYKVKQEDIKRKEAVYLLHTYYQGSLLIKIFLSTHPIFMQSTEVLLFN